ncbi:hypothetical protein GGTG_13451 [Gaeumannomyces tritici R3-111a-1]|uniref:C2H2-type domain-containing protein n=1 Tax=Gaeumannomyces tritici (strain R3-111a-1) TaxID=644352 RepID=J3PIX1_GAET3|nr:hypothetical protein GGTG_13451 [Gaeumannomyces tritici R3-111a-1]EJT69054.1 hypothetical protein GGTG_13451 [Gaeumannomyces tritici R3-111a-1]
MMNYAAAPPRRHLHEQPLHQPSLADGATAGLLFLDAPFYMVVRLRLKPTRPSTSRGLISLRPEPFDAPAADPPAGGRPADAHCWLATSPRYFAECARTAPSSVAGNVAAKNHIPQKDADGKFPCPHCSKTYLHAKHLKRHLLRHTGDRPYMCVLCRDTLSCILKRHFQKCSIRRGNPTSASHLSHPHAYFKS